MRVVLLHNPRSGRGRTLGAVSALRSRLDSADIDVTPVELGNGLTTDRLRESVCGADALIVAGGDGSVHFAAPAAIAAGVPIYHYALGTENLFAREFRSGADAESLLRALQHGRSTLADVASCNGRVFLIMGSVGFDAHVVERVAAARARGVRRSDYVRRALDEARNLRLPPLSVTADGQQLARNEPGLVIVANSPQYAARLNPCFDAKVQDGRLDVFFIPYRSSIRLAAWAASIALGMHAHARDARTARASDLRIASPIRGVPHQLDGESVAGVDAPLSLLISVQPRRLRVLQHAE